MEATSAVVVRLWLARMYDVDQVTLELYQSWFSKDEQQRYECFLHERRRREFIVGHGLARRALAEQLNRSPNEIQFEVAAQGQLVLGTSGVRDRLHFNITHTADFVGCATCRDYPVGIDVERLDGRVSTLEIAARFFSQAESKALSSLNDGERAAEFFTLWTIKESLAKAYGLGLAAPLESSRIRLDGESRIDAVTEYPPFSAGAWLACCSPTPQHRLALCVLCEQTKRVSILPQAPKNSGDVTVEGVAWATGRLRTE